jgi:hypothetical protein
MADELCEPLNDQRSHAGYLTRKAANGAKLPLLIRSDVNRDDAALCRRVELIRTAILPR